MGRKKLSVSETKITFPRQTKLNREDLKEIKKRGCILCGNIGSGKTYVAKHIYNGLTQCVDRNLNVLVFDTVGNWVYEDVKQPITLDDLRGTVTLGNNEILYLKSTDKEERLRLTKLVAETVFNSQQNLFRDSWLKKTFVVNKRFVFIIEEANTLFTTKSINKGFWLDFVAFARNYNIAGVYVTQRLSDSSTKIIERIPNFIIGQTRGFNDKLRIKRMLPNKDTKTMFENLKLHEFLCVIGNKKAFILKLNNRNTFEDIVKTNLRNMHRDNVNSVKVKVK